MSESSNRCPLIDAFSPRAWSISDTCTKFFKRARHLGHVILTVELAPRFLPAANATSVVSPNREPPWDFWRSSVDRT